MIDRAALLVIDVQNGFISEPRELPVLGGANVVPLINALLPRFPVRVAAQDWHPSDHGSFASRHPGAKPFDRGVLGDLRGVAKVYLAGLALDYCVRWSALDAHRLLPGAEVYVVVDATRPVDPNTGAEALRDLEQAGIKLVRSDEVLAGIVRAGAV